MRRVVKLSEVAEINPKIDPSVRALDHSTSVPFIAMASVSEDGLVDCGKTRSVSDVLTGYTGFRRGDVLLAKITPCFENGKAALLAELPADIGFGSTEFHVLRVGPEIDARFLLHVVHNERFRGLGQRNMTGTAGQKRLPAEFVSNYKLVLPSLVEQRRIVGILDRADTVRRKREESKRLVDELLRSVFLEMFGDPVRNEKGWPSLPLSQLAHVRRGASPRPIEQFMGGNVPWIKIGDATSSTKLYIERTAEFVTEAGARRSVLLHPGSVVVANSGVSLGFARILGISGCIHDGWLSVEEIDSRVRPVYFVSLINEMTQRLRTMAPSGTQPNLNTTLLKKLLIPLPPARLQEQFETVIRASQSLRQSLESATRQSHKLAVQAWADACGV